MAWRLSGGSPARLMHMCLLADHTRCLPRFPPAAPCSSSGSRCGAPPLRQTCRTRWRRRQRRRPTGSSCSSASASTSGSCTSHPAASPFPCWLTLWRCASRSCVLHLAAIAGGMQTAWACLLGGFACRLLLAAQLACRIWCPAAPCLQYNPSTIDINNDAAEMAYWIGVLQAGFLLHACSMTASIQRSGITLAEKTAGVCSGTSLPACLPAWVHVACVQDQIPHVVEKAATSEGGTPEAQRRAAAFGRALDLHLTRLRYAAAACLPAAPWLQLCRFGHKQACLCHAFTCIACLPAALVLLLQERAGHLWAAGAGRPV